MLNIKVFPVRLHTVFEVSHQTRLDRVISVRKKTLCNASLTLVY